MQILIFIRQLLSLQALKRITDGKMIIRSKAPLRLGLAGWRNRCFTILDEYGGGCS